MLVQGNCAAAAIFALLFTSVNAGEITVNHSGVDGASNTVNMQSAATTNEGEVSINTSSGNGFAQGTGPTPGASTTAAADFSRGPADEYQLSVDRTAQD